MFTSSWSSLVLISPELGLFVSYRSVSHPLSLWSTTYNVSGLAVTGCWFPKKLKQEKKSPIKEFVFEADLTCLVGDKTLHQKNINDLHLNFRYHYFKSKDFILN